MGGVCLRTDGTASCCRPQRRSTGNLDSKATGAGLLWCPVALLPASSPEKYIVLFELAVPVGYFKKCKGKWKQTGGREWAADIPPSSLSQTKAPTLHCSAAAWSQLSLLECLGAKKPEEHLPHRGSPAQDELHKRNKYCPAASRMTSQGLAMLPEPQAEAQLLCCLATQPLRVVSFPALHHGFFKSLPPSTTCLLIPDSSSTSQN